MAQTLRMVTQTRQQGTRSLHHREKLARGGAEGSIHDMTCREGCRRSGDAVAGSRPEIPIEPRHLPQRTKRKTLTRDATS